MKESPPRPEVKRAAKKAVAASVVDESGFRALFEFAGDAILIADIAGRFVDVNAHAVELIGYSRQEILHLPIFDIVVPHQWARLQRTLERTLGGEPQISEWEIIRKDGSTFPAETNARVLPDRRMVVILRDITKRKQTEEELFKSRRMLQLVLDTIPQRVFWKDLKSNFIGCNKPLATDTGFEHPSEIVGKNDYEISPKAMADLYTEDDRQVIETGVSKIGYEESLIKPDGTQLWLKTSKVPLRDKDGKIIGVLGTYEDITKQKEAEDALREARDSLEKRVQERTAQLRALAAKLTMTEQQERRRLAEILHDDLQQLLASVSLKLVPLLEIPEACETAREIRNLNDQAMKCSRTLSGDLCPPALLESGFAPALEWLSRWMKEKHGLSVNVKADEEAAVSLCEDLTLLLFRSVKELLFNVVKHAKVETASVKVGLAHGCVRIEVSDNGAGFDPEQVLSRGGDNTGFGLFNIRERVHLVGGCMEIFSKPGAGSRFIISVPVEKAATGTAERKPATKISRRGKSAGKAAKISSR